MIDKIKMMAAVMINKKGNFLDFMFLVLTFLIVRMQRLMNFCGKYKLLINNIRGKENLLIILTGYDEFLNKKVFERTKRFLDDDIDVCVVTPGKICDDVYEYCEHYGRSYLYTKQNKLALAQNIVIKLHNKAQYIYKIDGDIFITKGFFKNLKKKYKLALEKSEFIPSAIAPVININAWTYSYFLDTIGKKQEYINKFGNVKQDFLHKGALIYFSGNVAKYIWENTLKIDDVQEKYFSKIDIEKHFLSNSVRFAIGCFMFPRETRENLQRGSGFKQAEPGAMGIEEEQFLAYSIINSRPIVLCENTLCGHFSFHPQKQIMKDFFNKNIDKF